MPLSKLDDYYPNYREEFFKGYDIKNFEVIAQGDEKVGSVENILVDTAYRPKEPSKDRCGINMDRFAPSNGFKLERRLMPAAKEY